MALDKKRKGELLEEMEKYKAMIIHEGERAQMEEKNQYRNLRRFFQSQRWEMEREAKELKRIEHEALHEKELEDEEKLAQSLDKIKREEMKEMKLRQALRANSHELRELESKLRAAYVTKELTAQIAEKKAEKLRHAIDEKRQIAELDNAFINIEVQAKKTAEAELIKKTQYRQELQDQMILQEKMKRCKYEDFLREKKMIDDVVQRISEEDERELQIKYCKRLKTREEMDSFKAAQEMWRKKKKEELQEENRRIQEYLLSKAASVQEREVEKQRKEAMKTKISEDIARQIYAAESKKREREETIQELLQEEQKEAVDRRHRDEVEKEMRRRMDVRESLTRQMQEQAERRRDEAMADAKYKEQVIAKMAEDQRLEQLTAEKKRLRMIQLRKEIEEMMLQKRQAYAEQMQLNMKLLEQAEKEQETRRKIIEEERLRMLKEHAQNLIGFMPPGVLKPDDLPLLGSDVMKAYNE